MSIALDVVTAEKSVFSGDVDMVIAPGVQGQLGILPHHAPLMTILEPGELIIRKGTEEISLAVSGGFLEVTPEHIVVLADAAERAQEIDIQRAEAAMERARQALSQRTVPAGNEAAVETALRRSLARIRVSHKQQARRKNRPIQ